jgi:hypothetical protein
VNITQLRKQTGNSVAIPVIRAIAEKILESLQQQKPSEPIVKQLTLFDKVTAYP